MLTPGPQAEPDKRIERFGTTTGELRRPRDWLGARGITQTAMESTGVYWKPVFNILECACQSILVNTCISSIASGSVTTLAYTSS